jgi:hypothetical protein
MVKYQKSFIAVTFLLGFTACSIFRTDDEISLILPSCRFDESEVSGPDCWEISWLAEDGTVSHRRIESGRPPEILISRMNPVVITASPVLSGVPFPFQIRPAGYAVSGSDYGSAEAVLTWEHGFAADFLLNLADSGLSPELVNIRRFVYETDRRGGGNPWNLDVRRLCSDLRDGKLWVYSFRQLPVVPVSFFLPAGVWHEEYFPGAVIVSESGVWSGELTIGLHHMLCISGSMVISLNVDARGDVTIFSGD